LISFDDLCLLPFCIFFYFLTVDFSLDVVVVVLIVDLSKIYFNLDFDINTDFLVSIRFQLNRKKISFPPLFLLLLFFGLSFYCFLSGWKCWRKCHLLNEVSIHLNTSSCLHFLKKKTENMKPCLRFSHTSFETRWQLFFIFIFITNKDNKEKKKNKNRLSLKVSILFPLSTWSQSVGVVRCTPPPLSVIRELNTKSR